MRGPRRLARLDRPGLLFVLLFCNTFGVGAFGPLLPEIGRTQSLPDWQLGFVASAFGFARMAAAMPVGMLVVRRLAAALMAAPLILVLGLLLLVSAGPLPVLLVGRFLLGISDTLAMVGGLTAVLLEGGGTSVSTRLNLFEFAGMLGILGGLGTVALVPAAWGWKLALALVSAPVVVSLLLLPELRRRFPDAPSLARPATAPSDDMPGRRGDRGVVALMFGTGIVFALIWSSASAFVIPIRGTREFGLTRTGISWLLGMAQAIDLAALISRWAPGGSSGPRPDPRRRERDARLGTVAVGLGSRVWFGIGCACLGLGLAGWMLPLGVIRNHTPAARLGWRTGLYRVGVDAAIFLGPLLTGLLGRGGESVFLALAGAVALALGARLMARPPG